MPVNSDGQFCIDVDVESVFLECTQFESALTVEVYAAPPNTTDECWYLSGATMPSEWVECGGAVIECQ